MDIQGDRESCHHALTRRAPQNSSSAAWIRFLCNARARPATLAFALRDPENAAAVLFFGTRLCRFSCSSGFGALRLSSLADHGHGAHNTNTLCVLQVFTGVAPGGPGKQSSQGLPQHGAGRA